MIVPKEIRVLCQYLQGLRPRTLGITFPSWEK